MWFRETIVDTGRLPLFCFLCAFLVAFLFIRFSVRMIRAQVSWWPGNVTPGGMHIHHMVFGLVMMLVAGFVLIALADYATPVANIVLACVFGIGAALVLDEWALILHLSDVYWTQEGRSSIDAVFVAFTITAFFLLGIHPLGFQGDFDGLGDADALEVTLTIVFFVLQLLFAVVTLAKGKVWSGLVGLFIGPLLIVTAIRLGRPHSPWARWRYLTRPKKMEKAIYREKTYRRPVIRAKIAVQEAIAGHFDADTVNAATEAAQRAHEAATDQAAAAVREAGPILAARPKPL
jgi:fumarate reductase subunit C